jgi:sugar phosphate isomerase/epimerase
MLMHRPTDAMCRSARAKLDRAGIRCVSYYPATIKAPQALDDTVRFAKLLGAGNVSGDATGEMRRRIDEPFTREGLSFGIHNHFFQEKFPFESPDDVANALAGLSQTMGATVDVGQFASCGYDPVTALRTLAPRLKLVHLKDVKASGGEENVLLGNGVAKIPEVLRELRLLGFQGLVAIEHEKEGRVEEDVRREVEYARRLASQ